MPAADSLRTSLWTLLEITAAFWLVASLFVLANRMWFEHRNRRHILRTLSRRGVYQIIGRASTPDAVAGAAANYAVNRWGVEQIVRDASSHPRRTKWRRISALLTLTHLRHPGVHDLLARALEARQQDLAAAAVVGLARLGDDQAARILADALRRKLYAASRIATQLERFSVPLGDILHPLLEDPDSSTRYWAASILGSTLYTPAVARDVARLTADPDASVRKAAIEALSRLDDPAITDLARSRLTDQAPFVRSSAVRAIGRYADSLTDDEARARVARSIVPMLGDRSWEVRNAVKECLAQVGSGAWREVATQLESDDAFARNGAAEVLQDMGVIDTIVEKLARREATDPDMVRVLRRAFDAGGSRLVDAALRRRPA